MIRILSIIFLACINLSIVHGQFFTEVSDQLGVNESFGSGIFCGGMSFIDFDGDGWDDLSLCTEEGEAPKFFKNVNGVFEVFDLGIADTSENKQMVWADIDNDGDLDLYISNFNRPNRLYINDGDLLMEDKTVTYGLPLLEEESFGAALGDFNLDGYLDIYVVNRNNMPSVTNHLYQNNGGVSFTDVSLTTCTSDPLKVPFCASFVDINNDLLLDIYTASDRVGITNTLLKNLDGSKFEDITESAGADLAIDAMNVGFGDYNLDGYLDLYVTNTAGAGGSVLLKNNGDETFDDVTNSAGATWLETGWGGNFFDFDCDGDEDLYVSNIFGSNALFQNLGTGVFNYDTATDLEGDTLHSFANVIGDFNNDGQLDIGVSNEFGEPFLFWENNGSSNNWVKVSLQGVASNRDGIGAMIEVYVDGQKQIRYTATASAYLGQNSNKYHFGLSNETIVDTILIKWPNGHIDKHYNVPANTDYHYKEFSSSCPDLMAITNDPIPGDMYHAQSEIKVNTSVTQDLVDLRSGDRIVFDPGFSVATNALLQAFIEDCN